MIVLAATIGCASRDHQHPIVAEALADTSCAFVQEMQHPDPLQLAEEFAARDAQGEFTQTSQWFNAAVTCPGHEPGPDAAAVVRSHRVS